MVGDSILSIRSHLDLDRCRSKVGSSDSGQYDTAKDVSTIQSASPRYPRWCPAALLPPLKFLSVAMRLSAKRSRISGEEPAAHMLDVMPHIVITVTRRASRIMSSLRPLYQGGVLIPGHCLSSTTCIAFERGLLEVAYVGDRRVADRHHNCRWHRSSIA